MPRDTPPVTAETLLMAYASGVFPMAESRGDTDVYWVDPKLRGILPLDRFHLSRSLDRTLRRGRFRCTLNKEFDGVLEGCADREETWINAPIAALYRDLHELQLCHSLEVWQDDDLVGGVYGVTLGRAFFGESMFSRATDASKVALATIVALLRREGFVLFDTQFITDHLLSLGAAEIPRAEYHRRLRHALEGQALLRGPVPNVEEVRALRL